MAELNPYLVLGVGASATDAQIKAAYKKLAFKYHPDRNRGSDLSTERFKEVVAAYAILQDPDQRARYDRRNSAYRPSDSTYRNPNPAYKAGPSGPYKRGTYKEGDYYGTRPAPQAGSFMGRGGRRYSYPSAHHVFIALFLLACTGIGSLWFSRLMERQMAQTRLAEGNFIEALQCDSTYGEAWFALAENQWASGHYTSAWVHVNRAFRLASSIPNSWYWLRGRISEEMGDAQGAEHDYETCLSGGLSGTDSSHASDSCRYRLAGISIKKRKYAAAYELLSQSTKTAATQPSFVFLRGRAALASGRFQEALGIFQNIADARYHRADAYTLLGETYLALSDTANACKAWDIALTNGALRADTLMQQWCKFGSAAHAPYTLYVKPGSSY